MVPNSATQMERLVNHPRYSFKKNIKNKLSKGPGVLHDDVPMLHIFALGIF